MPEALSLAESRYVQRAPRLQLEETGKAYFG